MRKVAGTIMHSLTQNVERQPVETSSLSTLAVLLAGILALNIASAILALLAA